MHLFFVGLNRSVRLPVKQFFPGYYLWRHSEQVIGILAIASTMT
jgi:hypothetical protein